MKIIHFVDKACPCVNKIENFLAGLEVVGATGTVVECDCGNRFRMGRQTWIQVRWRGDER